LDRKKNNKAMQDYCIRLPHQIRKHHIRNALYSESVIIRMGYLRNLRKASYSENLLARFTNLQLAGPPDLQPDSHLRINLAAFSMIRNFSDLTYGKFL